MIFIVYYHLGKYWTFLTTFEYCCSSVLLIQLVCPMRSGPHEQLATAWIALSESREENGCVRLIPGSNNQVGPCLVVVIAIAKKSVLVPDIWSTRFRHNQYASARHLHCI